MEEFVSIIIPVYNREKYITECIKSLTSQDYKKLEIIVIDDGSTDNTLKISEALATESATGEAAQLYANIIAVKTGNEENAKIKALVAALQTEKVYNYIQNTFDGAVQAAFTL